MSFPLQNAKPSIGFKRGQFDFREVFDALLSQLRFQFFFRNHFHPQILRNETAVANERV